MRREGIAAKTRRKFRCTTDSNHGRPVAENVLDRRFEPEAPNRAWTADITYVATGEGWLYLAAVEDLYSRRIVGRSMGSRIDSRLVVDALEMALAGRAVIAGSLVHHSDRGIQYACGDYIERLEAAGVQPSMSRAGCPYDNAMAESFMKTLKHEEVDASDYRDLDHARSAIGDFIEGVYNRQRLHSALAYQSPMEFETDKLAAAAQ